MDASRYDENRQLKNGVIETYFKDGTLSTLGTYVDGEKDGEWQYYLKNGRFKAQGHYAHGKMTGDWVWYQENGELMQTGSFIDDEKADVRRFNNPQSSLLKIKICVICAICG